MKGSMRFALQDFSPEKRREIEAKLRDGATVRTNRCLTDATPGWTPEARAKASEGAKYKNVKVKLAEDGMTFDSKHEFRKYGELKLRQKAGEITDLRCQVKFALFDPGENCKGEHMGTYKADFVWKENGRLVVADAKSRHTAGLRDWKRTLKLMWACHGVRVRELVK